MADTPIPSPPDLGPAERRRTDDGTVPRPWTAGPAALLLRRRLRRKAARRAGRGLPGVGATVDDRTPEATTLETLYRAETNRVLGRILAAAHPLRARHRELSEWIAAGERLLAEAEAVRDRTAPGPPRTRMRGEDHLTDAALADRIRREEERRVERATVEARNLGTVLAAHRIERHRTEERLDALADDAMVQEQDARHRVTLALGEYVDELVHRHPRGDLLSSVTWPVAFAVPPDWAQDPARLRAVVNGGVNGGCTDGRDDRARP